MSVYAKAVEPWRATGIGDPLPLGVKSKVAPPEGFTGHDGASPSESDYTEWVRDNKDGNVCLRLKANVVGIDVDAYIKKDVRKRGDETLAKIEEAHCPLPPAFTSTSREGISGIRMYRCDPRLIEQFPGTAGPDIEIIKHDHRYMLVYPSIHPEGGTYSLYSPSGEIVAGNGTPAELPTIDELPELPEEWIRHLLAESNGGCPCLTGQKPLTGSGIEVLPARFGDVPKAVADLTAALANGSSRYDTARDVSLFLIGEGSSDAMRHLHELRSLYIEKVADSRERGEKEAASEWDRFVTGAEKITGNTVFEPDTDADPLIVNIEALDLSKLDDAIPDDEMLVDPLIATGRRTKIQAIAGDGKSLLALFIAACLATGRACLRRAAGPPVRVIYLDQEMIPADIQERLESMGFDYTNDTDLQQNLRYYLHQDIEPLNTKRGADQVLALVVRDQAEFVVVDTITSHTEGNENESEPYRQMANLLTSKLVIRGISSLTLDHVGKKPEAGGRGSSAKRDAFDVIWQLTSTPDTYTLKLDKGRMSSVPLAVVLAKKTDPNLIFTMPMLQVSDYAAKLLKALDRLGISHKTGRPTIEKALKEAGIAYKTKYLGEAIRWRKLHPRTVGTGAGTVEGTGRNENGEQVPGTCVSGNPDYVDAPKGEQVLGTGGNRSSEVLGTVPPLLGGNSSNPPCPACTNLRLSEVCKNKSCDVFGWGIDQVAQWVIDHRVDPVGGA